MNPFVASSGLSNANIRLAACECITPFGNTEATFAALLQNQIALQSLPVCGNTGDDLVPLALFPGHALQSTASPRWLPVVQKLLAPVSGSEWGTARRPIYITSSNFCIGNLVAYQQTKDRAHLAYGSPALCVEWLRRELGWGRSITTFSHACVSAHIGLLQASRAIQSGLADEALVFTFDFLSPFVTGGFHALKILNSNFPAPYAAKATGSIGLGEGAGYTVLSRDRGEFAIKAQSHYNELHHFTSNQPDGSGFRSCLGPLSEAAAGKRIWFKGHGTGTLDAARLEAETVSAIFPEAPLVGWKGSLGHTLGSCGIVELALAAAALRSGKTPGTVGTTHPTTLHNVATDAFDNTPFEGVVCASNAFGGAHAALLLTRHD
ncbi:MAG: beta-ketoacyl synthase N-terminal-like domain-containing protein [Verrucomicrobiota bacterium]